VDFAAGVHTLDDVDNTTSQRHLSAADGLRGIAVIATMVFHIQFFSVVTGTALWERSYAMAAGLGWAGVDLFFVLSGFLITGILYESRSQPHYFRVFYLRRTVRIFPLYYAVLFLFFVLLPVLVRFEHVAPSTAVFGTMATQLFAWSYMVNWDLAFQGFGVVSPLIAHFWSLSIEEQFYLAWPAVVRGLSRHWLMALCGLMAVSAALVRIVLFHRGWPTAAYVLPFARMDGLAIGAFIALAARDTSDWASLCRWAPTVTLVAAAALVSLIVQTGTTAFGDPIIGTVGISLLCVCFGGVLVLLINGPANGRAQRVVGSPTLRWFGKYSYCLYVVNQPAMLILAKLGLTVVALQAIVPSRALAILSVNVVGIAVCAVVAYASWQLFEKHWLALKLHPLFNHPGVAAMADTANPAWPGRQPFPLRTST
jgi:peptidoglycan/LPS O-acetylase OafA/YrhL